MTGWGLCSSLKRKLVLVSMLTSAGAVSLACAASLTYALAVANVQARQNLAALAHVLGANSTAALAFNDTVAGRETLTGLKANTSVDVARVLRSDGTLFAAYESGLADSWAERAFTSSRWGTIEVKQPIRLDEEAIGAIELRGTSAITTARMGQLALVIGAVMLMAAGVACWLASRLQSLISAPILALAETAREVSRRQDYSLRAEKICDDEVGVLVDRFNEMLIHVDKCDRQLQWARDEALAASRLKSEFVANMSHEARTPINGIFGLIEMLLDTPLNDTQREYVERMKHSGQALLHVINDVLDLSKIEAGKLEIEPVMFELHPLLAQAIEPVQFRATEKGLLIETRCADDVPAIVFGDPARVRQILLNLVHNAVKFTHQGRIAVHVSTATADDGHLRFEVTDTGIGIPPGRLSDIFEKFTQADSSTTRRFGGSGLGLTICRQLAHLLGGRIGVDSQPQKGSTFWFELPLLAVAVPHATAGPGSSASVQHPVASDISLNGLRVLLAEDDETNQRVAKYFLTKQGCEVDIAANGRFAVDLASRHRYDLVLMDCQMPDIDGYQATRQIRGLPDYHDVPIIAMTANAMRGDREACLDAGMTDYLAKPVLLEDIEPALARWWGGVDPGCNTVVAKSIQPPDAPFDSITLEKMFAGDRAELANLVALLEKDLPIYFRDLQSRLAQGDLAGVAALAHKIRGAAANAVAGAVCDVTKALEVAARAGDLARTTAWAKQLDRAQVELLEGLEAWLTPAPQSGIVIAPVEPSVVTSVVPSGMAEV